MSRLKRGFESGFKGDRMGYYNPFKTNFLGYPSGICMVLGENLYKIISVGYNRKYPKFLQKF